MTIYTGRKIRNACGKCIFLCLGLVFLASCRLVITTDETGYITSASGSHGCDQPSCAIPISGPFTDTFTAVPAKGYRFVRWEGVCITSPREVCRLALLPLPDEYSEYDRDVGMSAVFEPSSAKRAKSALVTV